MIGYVPQELYLFHDTLRNNITLKDTEINDEAIWSTLEQCDAKAFVQALPDGLDTIIGERGSKLSGGQSSDLLNGIPAPACSPRRYPAHSDPPAWCSALLFRRPLLPRSGHWFSGSKYYYPHRTLLVPYKRLPQRSLRPR
jgi:hypothetical protein